MDKLFNFEDETLNKGFQIDMSLLSPEQREHVLKIFEARGYFHKNYKTLKDSWDSIIKYPLVCFNPNGNDCSLAYYGNGTSKENIRKNLANNALIDYPTLCRAAVQLEPREYAIGNTLEIRELFEYAKYIGLCQFVKYVGGENAIYCTPHRTIYTTINLNKGSLTINEFEAKLRGVSPVVKQSLTTEKPDFFNPDINGDPITAKGLVDWCKAYSMRKEKPVEVSPETEQPNSNEADMATARLAIGQQLDIIWLKGYDFGLKKLEQENAELKADKEEVSKMAVNLERDNQGMAKRIAELEAQLAVKNEPLSNTEQLPVGTIVHIVIEFDNRKGYRMLHISEPNCTCKKAFEWAHNQASMVEGIITSYDYAFPPKKQ